MLALARCEQYPAAKQVCFADAQVAEHCIAAADVWLATSSDHRNIAERGRALAAGGLTHTANGLFGAAPPYGTSSRGIS